MADTTSDPSRRTIERYTPNERTNHWTVAIVFILTALSGLALFHPALYWLSGLLGGGTWTRILHPFLGVLMAICFALLAATMWKFNRMERRDWQWLRQGRDVLNNREANAPEVGRYNGGQKLLFFVFVLCVLGLLLSGLVIWRQYFSLYFSVGVVRAAAVVHAICAFVMICAIVVHIYAAFWVKGSIAAMTRGTVTPGWAWKHHRAWFREKIHATHSRTRSD
ncbi:formate dehydrogenase subunit gamma [Peristeroidobacter soli]|jgi:formate dehydrogenase subunit gamma|uniref:formate dehydrogenase subunit gamma n=1 Tax=Peristeroidobacter soli TaxID=2497877 RepID=UPI00101C114F|nr:formate dehydrogenase subunit gamma [Peristeroidobacter soli]